jgi:hypothetical protein
MRRLSRSLPVLVLVLAVALGGCVGKTGADTILLTGQAMQALKAEFLSAAATYDALYTAKRMPEAQYQAWRVFVPKFQAAYAAAYATWRTAATTQDATAAARVQAVVDTLRAQVLTFTLGLPTQ